MIERVLRLAETKPLDSDTVVTMTVCCFYVCLTTTLTLVATADRYVVACLCRRRLPLTLQFVG